MAASTQDYFQKAGTPGSATNLAAPGHTIGGTTFTVSSTAGFPSDTGFTFAIDQVDSSGVRVAGTYTVWTGVVTSATGIGSGVLRYGTDQNYSAGATTRVIVIPTTTWQNRLVDGLLIAHGQDGLLKTNVAITTNAATLTTPTLTSPVIKTFDGWQTAANTWVYVSASSFKITGTDVSALFPVGTKIKLTQTTTKYFYVTAASFSTDTTVTVTGGTDYTLANASITTPFYSYEATPQGFPQTFAYAGPLTTNISVNKGTTGTASYTFNMVGKRVKVKGFLIAGGTGIDFGSGGSAFTIPLPVTISSASAAQYSTNVPLGIIYADDTGSSSWQIMATYNNTTTAAGLTPNGSGDVKLVAWTNSAPISPATGDSYKWSFEYDV